MLIRLQLCFSHTKNEVMEKEAVHILCYPFSFMKLFNEACNKNKYVYFCYVFCYRSYAKSNEWTTKPKHNYLIIVCVIWVLILDFVPESPDIYIYLPVPSIEFISSHTNELQKLLLVLLYKIKIPLIRVKNSVQRFLVFQKKKKKILKKKTKKIW